MTAPKEILTKNTFRIESTCYLFKKFQYITKNSIVTSRNIKRKFLNSETAKLFMERKIVMKDQVEKDQVELYKFGKNKYFIMCIDTYCSQSLISKSIQK